MLKNFVSKQVPAAFLSLFLCLACTSKNPSARTTSEGKPVGGYKGLIAINQILQLRLLTPDAAAPQFSITRYFGQPSGEPTGLAILLGAYGGEDAHRTFQNGTPSPMSMLLWQMILTSLAEDIARSCDQEGGPRSLGDIFPYNQNFITHLKPLCSWPSPAAKNDSHLLGLWLALMGYDAPREEYESWKEFFLSPESPFSSSSRTEAILAMARTIFLSPFFLLEH